MFDHFGGWANTQVFALYSVCMASASIRHVFGVYRNRRPVSLLYNPIPCDVDHSRATWRTETVR